MNHERITAADVEVGDRIAKTRNEAGDVVAGITDAGKSRWIEFDTGVRIRPRYATKLWRLHDDADVEGAMEELSRQHREESDPKRRASIVRELRELGRRRALGQV